MSDKRQLCDLSLIEAATKIRQKEISCVDLVESCLQRSRMVESEIHAFVILDEEGALQSAEALDKELTDESPRSLVHGVPMAVKDIFDVEGFATRCGCSAYDDIREAGRDSHAVARLRAAGAVIVGKTVTHELACGVYSPPTRNPWDLDRSAGGSSGGSAAAVASGSVMAATGSDTGGSIRIPAALCGVVGIKPTYDLVKRSGVAALSWSLDHVGPLAATVGDAVAVLAAMIEDPHLEEEAAAQGQDLDWHALTVGIPGSVFGSPRTEDVDRALDQARNRIAGRGAKVVDVDLPELDDVLRTEFCIVMAEAASYHEELIRNRPSDIGAEVRQLLQAGMLLPAHAYLSAQRSRSVIAEALKRAFSVQGIDVLVSPTLPATAQRMDETEFRMDGSEEDVTNAFVRTTAPFNLSGLPAISIPWGLSGTGLPIGIQLAGPPYSEGELVGIAKGFESIADWPQARPIPKGIEGAVRSEGSPAGRGR
jgi:aspartyl-tRNA(Asn)/glutamyl-tRNA(Gln) amidotransferase subunit A